MATASSTPCTRWNLIASASAAGCPVDSGKINKDGSFAKSEQIRMGNILKGLVDRFFTMPDGARVTVKPGDPPRDMNGSRCASSGATGPARSAEVGSHDIHDGNDIYDILSGHPARASPSRFAREKFAPVSRTLRWRGRTEASSFPSWTSWMSLASPQGRPLMTHDLMMMYLSRRADYLARRVAEAEAVGRTLTWDKGELAALQAAIGRLESLR